MQRQLIEKGSALQWLASAGVFPERNGKPADDRIRHAVGRMEQTPGQWIMTVSPRDVPFAVPSGSLAWAAAFEALKRDPNAQLPVD